MRITFTPTTSLLGFFRLGGAVAVLSAGGLALGAFFFLDAFSAGNFSSLSLGGRLPLSSRKKRRMIRDITWAQSMRNRSTDQPG